MTTAVSSDTTDRLAIGGSAAIGRSSASTSRPSRALKAAIRRSTRRSRNVAEPFQLLLDFLLRVGRLELRDLLLERVRDELLDRGVAGQIGVALHLGEERLVQFEARSEHRCGLPYRFAGNS